MYITLALVVLIFSIIVFFSQEFTQIIKRVFAITGAKILLPMALSSWAIYTFEEWFLWAINYILQELQFCVAAIIRLLPFQQWARPIALILLLTVISVVPSLILQWLSFKRRYKEYKYPYLTSTIIWMACSILLLNLLGTGTY